MPDIKKFFPSQTVANWTSGAFGGGTTPFAATGGTTNTYTDSGTNYKSHTFTSSSTFTVTGGEKICQVFLVGGGGAGLAQNGNYCSGGAGAGGYLLASTVLSAIGGNGAGSYTVTIGAGGTAGYVYPYGGVSDDSGGIHGNNSSFAGLVAYGGGGGGDFPWKETSGELKAPTAGGCGAGAGATSGHYFRGARGLQGGRGNDPSGSMHSEVGAGGGGHSGGGNENRNGNDGSTNTYKDNTSITYGGGGGGCDNGGITAYGTVGSGGSGGGGAAHGGTSGNATSGTANTGGGGGSLNGGYYYSQMYAGSGGSGIVIVRYEV